ncbi:MAG: SMP-30/gluconolactonase/LRE family protein [Dysgonamonadaceae bacterium]|jgi:gluconolactonase|nr:SMP-30/gluconolactonase/LRE family protein [Dysgonamonadaceae bacterium]
MKTLSIIILSLIPLFAFTQKSSLIFQNAEIERQGTEFSFTEGATTAPDGRVFFTDQPNDRIYIWCENEGVSLWLEGTERANGMYFTNGQLFACADENNRIVVFDEDKNMTIIHEKYDNIHLNGPNDLWVAPNGNIYFTDPYYHRPWWAEEHREAQPYRGVYFLCTRGEVQRVINDFEMPNGIVGTPDGKTLYVADIKAGKTWKYDILPNGNLTNKTFFAPHGSDGMTIDEHGNVYLTIMRKVWIYSPEGILLKEIEFPEAPSSIAFGGKERNILFVTARTSVYTLKMNVKGVN